MPPSSSHARDRNSRGSAPPAILRVHKGSPAAMDDLLLSEQPLAFHKPRPSKRTQFASSHGAALLPRDSACRWCSPACIAQVEQRIPPQSREPRNASPRQTVLTRKQNQDPEDEAGRQR